MVLFIRKIHLPHKGHECLFNGIGFMNVTINY